MDIDNMLRDLFLIFSAIFWMWILIIMQVSAFRVLVKKDLPFCRIFFRKLVSNKKDKNH